MRPLRDNEHAYYPACFVVIDERTYGMWCQAIVLMRSRMWYVCRSRVVAFEDYNFFDDLLR